MAAVMPAVVGGANGPDLPLDQLGGLVDHRATHGRDEVSAVIVGG